MLVLEDRGWVEWWMRLTVEAGGDGFEEVGVGEVGFERGDGFFDSFFEAAEGFGLA